MTTNFIELYGGYSYISDEPVAKIIAKEGAGRIKVFRKATEEDIEWVKGMGISTRPAEDPEARVP